MLFHYNGHGVPRPTSNGEVWMFNPVSDAGVARRRTGAVPDVRCGRAVSSTTRNTSPCPCTTSKRGVARLPSSSSTAPPPRCCLPTSWRRPVTSTCVRMCRLLGLRARSCQQRCLAAGVLVITVVPALTNCATCRRALTKQQTGKPSRRGKPRLTTQHQWIVLAACSDGDTLPLNPDLPADLFTACLTTPIKTALRWCVSATRLPVEVVRCSPPMCHSRFVYSALSTPTGSCLATP